MVGVRCNKGLPGCFWRYIMVWFPGVSGFGFRGVSGVCFGVAQDGVLLGGGFWRFWVCFLFWFVRTWGWGFRGCAGFLRGAVWEKRGGDFQSHLNISGSDTVVNGFLQCSQVTVSFMS